MPVNTFWGSERINHPTSVHAWYRGPTGFNGSQCVKEWFSRYFSLLPERFFGFLHLYFRCIFSSCERGFFGFYFYVLRFFCIFFLFYHSEVWVFLRESDLC